MKKEVAVKATALIVDGAYARIQARTLGGKIDFARLRTELEEMNSTEFEECWYFDSQRYDARGNSELAAEFHALKYAHPQGPQFQVEMFSTKRYNCRCPDCGNRFTQNVQKSVDNGIATKLLTLTVANRIERVVLFSGDSDFYSLVGIRPQCTAKGGLGRGLLGYNVRRFTAVGIPYNLDPRHLGAGDVST